ncbi:MAG TPA: zinc ribbon domain-containing protein, partial [Pseudonocardiaceae bacterium]|nr:zinc ribbon domain-containing protein [Pseudonocardiaceae bacterium]
ATFWAAPGGNTQPTLIVEFERPVNLVSAIVHNGGGEAFQALSRPRDLHLSYFDGNRPLGASDVTLTDAPDEQQIDLEGRDGTTRVEVQVLSFYTSPQSPDMALSYLEFFERQS